MSIRAIGQGTAEALAAAAGLERAGAGRLAEVTGSSFREDPVVRLTVRPLPRPPAVAQGGEGLSEPGAPVGATAAQVEQVARELSSLSAHVTFIVDEDRGEVVVKVLDPRTREVVRQIPPESLLDIRRRLDAYLGLLTDAVA